MNDWIDWVCLLSIFGAPLLVVFAYAASQGVFERTPADLHDRALPRLTEMAADNPRLAALLAEVDRGRTRRQEDTR